MRGVMALLRLRRLGLAQLITSAVTSRVAKVLTSRIAAVLPFVGTRCKCTMMPVPAGTKSSDRCCSRFWLVVCNSLSGPWRSIRAINRNSMPSTGPRMGSAEPRATTSPASWKMSNWVRADSIVQTPKTMCLVY